MQQIKDLLPHPVKSNLKIIRKFMYQRWYGGDKYHCPVCASDLKYFHPMPPRQMIQMQKHGYIFSIFDTETYSPATKQCPICLSYDRTRLYKLYFDRFFADRDPSKTYTMIDFAPTFQLESFFRTLTFLNYRTADLLRTNVDDTGVDLTDMQNHYDSDSVDIFLCSHILEHIPDDVSAIRELYRITKPGGWGIVMAPIILSLDEDYENHEAQTTSDKWRHFGQGDHIRLYSKKGFIQKLRNGGFTVQELDVQYFGKEKLQQIGMNLNAVLYVVEKKSTVNPQSHS